MKKIAYIELDTHAEIALNFMELMQDSKEFSVDYYFSEKILKNLGLQENGKITKSNHQTIIKQLQTQKYDLVIIGTVHRYFNVFDRITEKFNTSIICHNLNFVKATNFDLFASIFKEDIQYRLKLLLKEGLLRKSKVYQKAKNLLVLDENLVKEHYRNLPIFYTKFSEKFNNETFNIVIPGAVSQKRRDYEKVLKQLENFTKNSHYQVIFLGKAQGKELEMLQNFEKSRPKNISIKYFKNKVSQSEFDFLMQKADILWCPIQQETEFFSNKEIYGITKMSGNIGDAIKYRKPAVFPPKYQSDLSFVLKEKSYLENLFFERKEQNFDFSEFAKEKVLKQLEKTIFALL